MQNIGQSSENKSYPVILLLVVGLAAFSSAMKELNQAQEFSAQTAAVVAQWKDALAPIDDVTIERVETCQNSQTLLPAPPPLPAVPPSPPVDVQVAIPSVVTPAVTPTPAAPPAPPARPAVPAVREVPNPRRAVRPVQTPAEVRVVIKNRRYIFVTPDVRDSIFKSLSRTFEVRSAG